MTSYARPAMTGRRRMRLRISQWSGGLPTNANTKIAITMTQSKKAVPQRGWIKLNLCTLAGVSSAPASSALIVLCSAPWYWKTRRGADLEEHEREPDRDREGDGELGLPDLRLDLAVLVALLRHDVRRDRERLEADRERLAERDD